jgi:chorismate synthase
MKVVPARYERSDVCAVPACSVIAEAVIAPVLANAFLEKFGGDSVSEILKRYKKSKR